MDALLEPIGGVPAVCAVLSRLIVRADVRTDGWLQESKESVRSDYDFVRFVMEDSLLPYLELCAQPSRESL